MKVLNLRCAQAHQFEGWFASEDDFQSQLGRSLVECPICSDKAITKLPSAPRLNVSRSREPLPEATAPAEAGNAGGQQAATLQSAWLRAVQHVMANTVDVGERFAEEARRIHYGEAEERAIRGKTSPEDAVALREEGIEVMSLPLPSALKGSIQ